MVLGVSFKRKSAGRGPAGLFARRLPARADRDLLLQDSRVSSGSGLCPQPAIPSSATPSRALSALALTLALLVPFPRAAHANGRFPNAQQLREIDARTLVVAGTYGMLMTTNGGLDFAYQCEGELFGKPTGTYTVDPLLEVGADGAIYSGSLHGLRVSRDRGCTFETESSLPRNWSFFELERPEGAESGQAIDVCRRGGDADAPVLALVGMLDDSGRTTEYRLYETDARGAFGVVGAPIAVAEMDYGLTLEVAPSDPDRMYVTGTLANDPVLLASDDGGLTFRGSPLSLADAEFVLGAYLGAVAPDDPERVYLRVARRVPTTDGLYVRGDSLALSSDGGRSVTEVLRAEANLLGFALSPDGAVVLAGYGDPRVDETLSSPSAVGLYRADSVGLSFEPVARDVDVSCLRFGDEALYACLLERDPLGTDPSLASDFHLGVWSGSVPPSSIDDFTPLLKLRDVRGPPRWADGRVTACEMEWTGGDPSSSAPLGTCARLNACDSVADPSDGALVCGEPSGAAGAAATDGGDEESGCGCRIRAKTPKNPFGALAVLVVSLSVLARRRARRVTRMTAVDPEFGCGCRAAGERGGAFGSMFAFLLGWWHRFRARCRR